MDLCLLVVVRTVSCQHSVDAAWAKLLLVTLGALAKGRLGLGPKARNLHIASALSITFFFLFLGS
jgi:hypothetical protein